MTAALSSSLSSPSSLWLVFRLSMSFSNIPTPVSWVKLLPVKITIINVPPIVNAAAVFVTRTKNPVCSVPPKVLPPPANITPIISKSPVATQSALCEEITRIQRTYCGTIITPPVTTPYPITTPFPTRLPSSKPTKAPVSGI